MVPVWIDGFPRGELNAKVINQRILVYAFALPLWEPAQPWCHSLGMRARLGSALAQSIVIFA